MPPSWSDFTTATTMGGFCHSWLALQCKLLDGVRVGMVLTGAPDQGPFRPMAIWPDKRRNLGYLTNPSSLAFSGSVE